MDRGSGDGPGLACRSTLPAADHAKTAGCMIESAGQSSTPRPALRLASVEFHVKSNLQPSWYAICCAALADLDFESSLIGSNRRITHL